MAKNTAGFPNVCSVGVSAGLGVGGNMVGRSYDSKKGVRFGASQRVGSAGPVTATFRGSTPGGKASGAVTVRDPVTGIGAGAAIDQNGQPSVNLSVQKGVVQVGVNATLGTMGDPNCQPR